MPDRELTRRQTLTGIFAGVTVGLTGCSADDLLVGQSPGADEDGGAGTGTTPTDSTSARTSLTVELIEGPRGFDPLSIDHVPSRVIFQHMFQGLYAYTDGVDPAPLLARESPEVSDGGRTWIVQLRGGVRFQNGDPLTTDDVRYSFTAPREENTDVGSLLRNIDEVQIRDGSRVEFRLDGPDPAFIHTLTQPIVPMAVRERDPAAFDARSPVGSGPYRYSDVSSDGAVRLERWPEYWGDRAPNIGELEFRFEEGATSRTSALAEGPAQLVELASNEAWQTAIDVPNARIEAVPRLVYYYLAFNCRAGPTADRRVREAIDFAIDLDAAIESIVEPAGVRQYSPLPPAVAENWGFPTERWASIPHEKDIGRARGLVEEAGISAEYPWRIIVPPDDIRVRLADVIASGLSEIGFTSVSVERLEWGAFLGRYTSGDPTDYNMYLLGWRHHPDPGSFTLPLFGRSPGILGVTNGTFYGGENEPGASAVRKLARATSSVSRPERKRLYEEAITTILEDRVHLPAYNIQHSFGVHEVVSDLHVVPTDDKFHVFSRTNNAQMNQ